MKNKKLKKKILSYSSIAASALAIAGQAESAVVYSGPQNIVVDSNNTFAIIDLDNNTNPDLGIFYRSSIYSQSINAHIIYGYASMINERFNSTSPPIFPVNLPAGYGVKSNLGPGRYWVSFGLLDVYNLTYGSYGNFIGKTGYIGVRFSADCGTAYGWIQYRANSNATVGTIIDWAYENTCQPIRAGDTGQQVAVPALTPAGLAIAAGLLSGAGIRALRKREKNK